MARSINNLIALLLVTLVYTASAHRQAPRSANAVPYGWRNKRAAITASSCSYMTCAASLGSCGNSSSIVICPDGEYCDGTNCVASLALGIPCNVNAPENPCSSGTCMDSGNGGGSMCQIYREILPGNACTDDNQCYYSESADGSSPVASSCLQDTRTCRGQTAGQTCVATHQCVTGTFCSESSKTCTPLGNGGDVCSSNAECNTRFSCLNTKCVSRYSQAEGAACSATEHCAGGLYCKSGVCAKAPTGGRTSTTCDIANNGGCNADQQCSCNGFQTPSQTATCAAIKATPASMYAIEQGAYTCLDRFGCGSDVNNATTVACIIQNCQADYCTYFTRTANDLFTQYPSCLLSRMVSSQQYFELLTTCRNYQPTEDGTSTTTGTSSASVLSASFTCALLVVFAVFFFEF